MCYRKCYQINALFFIPITHNISKTLMNMVKTKMLVIRLTEEQNELLQERTKSAGFWKKSEYVRTILFIGANDGI